MFVCIKNMTEVDTDDCKICVLGPCWRERRTRTARSLRFPGGSTCHILHLNVWMTLAVLLITSVCVWLYSYCDIKRFIQFSTFTQLSKDCSF